jgi:hypothetical protein
VAGDLGSIHSEYKTTSGKVVQLGIFSDKENVGELFYLLNSSLYLDIAFLSCIAAKNCHGLREHLHLGDRLILLSSIPPLIMSFSLQFTIYTHSLTHFSSISLITQVS